MGWNVFAAITIKKAQNNRRTSEKYKQEDITSYYVLGLLPETYVWNIFEKIWRITDSSNFLKKSSKQKNRNTKYR